MGREQVEGQRGGRDTCQPKNSFCWNPAELGTGLGFPPATSSRQEQGHRDKSLRAAESMLASAAPSALVIPCHTGGWHRRAVRPSLPTARTPQMATNPQERKHNRGEHVERLQRVSSTPREIVRWAVWVLQSKPAAVMVFVGDSEMVYAQCPQAACTAHHPAEHSASL